MGYDGTLKFNTEINEKGFSAGTKKLGTIAQTALGFFSGQMMTKAVDGIVNLGKATLATVASLEQNLGGVETLFKNSAQSVIANAKDAYMSAGLSANAYMETVTSFSASLLQSLGGDTAKAAEYADRAVVDMSDNANKMGTSMEMIQNAYQGFAKQNYTMLDNLKLGYGGTKEEMQRLVRQASELTEVQEELGLTVDENSMSFGNIVNAISVMQKHMGIAGATSEEAATTISGSVEMMKSAWDNFLNGTGSPEALAEAMAVAGENVLAAVGEIIPRLVETVPIFLATIVESIRANLPTIMAVGGELLTSLITGAMALIGQLGMLALNIVVSLVNGITQNAPKFLAKGTELFTKFRSDMESRLPEILKTGTDIIVNLLNGLLQEAPQIIQQAGDMMAEFIKCLLDALPLILESGAEMMLSLLNGLIANAPKIITQIAQTMANFIAKIGAHLPQISQKGIEIIGKLLAGILQKAPSIIAAIPGIISGIVSAFMNKDWGSIGKNIITGIASGVKSAAGKLVRAAVNAAKDAVNKVKSWLGIHSPSTRMRDEVGKYMATGMGVGFEKNIPTDDMVGGLEDSVKRLQRGAMAVTSEASPAARQALCPAYRVDGNKGSGDEVNSSKEIIIHTHVELDGEEIGHSTVRTIDKDFAHIDAHKKRGG